MMSMMLPLGAHAAAFASMLTAIPRMIYTLPPGVLERARSLYYWRTALDFGSTLWGILVLLALLNFRWAAGLGAWAASVTRKPWLQGFCFAPLILLLLSLLAPATRHPGPPHLAQLWSIHPGLGQLVSGLGQGTAARSGLRNLVLSVVFALIRNSRRWWLWLWVVSLPMQVLVVFVLPLVGRPACSITLSPWHRPIRRWCSNWNEW